eukprot:2447720-Rhodomonas_salina.1
MYCTGGGQQTGCGGHQGAGRGFPARGGYNCSGGGQWSGRDGRQGAGGGFPARGGYNSAGGGLLSVRGGHNDWLGGHCGGHHGRFGPRNSLNTNSDSTPLSEVVDSSSIRLYALHNNYNNLEGQYYEEPEENEEGAEEEEECTMAAIYQAVQHSLEQRSGKLDISRLEGGLVSTPTLPTPPPPLLSL